MDPLISRKFSGMKCFLRERSLNQPKAKRVCIRSTNQSNCSISVRLLFLFCSRVFISRSDENRSIDPKDLPKYRNRPCPTWPSYIHCFPNYTEPFKSQLDKVINWLKSKEPPQFIGVYIDHPDWEGHDYGSHSRQYKEAMEKVDREVVAYLTKRLRDVNLIDNVNLIFVSDHSFNNISSARQIFLDDYLDRSAYMMTESTALGHIWPKDDKLEEIFVNLTNVKNPHMKIYKKQDIPESFHWKHNRRIPPIFIDPE